MDKPPYQSQLILMIGRNYNDSLHSFTCPPGVSCVNVYQSKFDFFKCGLYGQESRPLQLKISLTSESACPMVLGHFL